MAVGAVRAAVSSKAYVTCGSCGHDELAMHSWLTRAWRRLGPARKCCYAVGDEISPLRNELCGCSDPLHALR